MPASPHLIELLKNYSKAAHLSVLEKSRSLPIEIKRIYRIYDIAKDVERVDHANRNADGIQTNAAFCDITF